MYGYVIQLCDNPQDAQCLIDPDTMDESAYSHADYFEDPYLNRTEAKKVKEDLARLLNAKYYGGSMTISPEAFRNFFAECIRGAKRQLSEGIEKLDLDSFESVHSAIHKNGFQAKNYLLSQNTDLLISANDYKTVYTPAEFLDYYCCFKRKRPKRFWFGGILGYHY